MIIWNPIKKFSKNLDKNTWLILLSILAIAFLMRAWHLNTDLLFHRDQGLHSLAIWNIWHERHFSLLGHPSDVDGLIHAPIYYWLMLPAYFLTGGDPVAASLFQILLEVICWPFFFIAISRIFNRKTAWITLIVYTFSYGYISFSRWLVNVTPAIPFSFVLLYFLSENNKKKIVLNAGICALIVGIIAQLNAAIGIFLFPYLLWHYRQNLKKTLLPLIVGFSIPALPLLVFELRHQFVITNAVMTFSKNQKHGLGLSFGLLLKNLRVFLVELTKITTVNRFWITSLMFFAGLWQTRRLPNSKLIFFYLLIPFLGLALFQRGAIGFFYTALIPLALAVICYFIAAFPTPISAAIIILLFSLNAFHLPKIYKPENALIPIGDGNLITIQDRKNIIDWLYKEANNKPFGVWFYTLPYYQEEVWQYMFSWYAAPKYGYLPEKTGGFSPEDLKTAELFFKVYEPDEYRPKMLIDWKDRATLNFGPVNSSFGSHDLYVDRHASTSADWQSPREETTKKEINY